MIQHAPTFPHGGGPRRPRILIVDDEPNLRVLLRRALSGGEYELFEAPDGETAWQILRTAGADLVLSDLLMPGMRGTELLRLAKDHDDAVGFIILTGVGTMENAIEALRLQADDYLLKPFNLDEVTLAVERALRHRRLVLENRYYQGHLESRVAEQAQQIETLFVDALMTIASAVEARDGYTGGHIERVTRYAVSTGRVLGIGDETLGHLWVAGLLHDLGKVAIPDQILGKPGRLTAEEYGIMQQHPSIGAAILERSPYLRPALPGVLHHHERWDGAGYPSGLRGEEISLEGRILAVADTYDAIVTTRPYREERPPEVAVEEIRRCSGSQFDPQVVDAFLRAHDSDFPGEGELSLVPRRALEPVPV
ncbi:MAG TPA: HD domain-containing phosphohydrolase [Longimicrobiaceae bacterium]|nr:HD domain-containing phosphohydrolase [Longimicrobiaceae bacterium]